MSINDLMDAIIKNGNDIHFIYNGRKSGVESTVVNSVFTFQAWYGSRIKVFSNFNDMISDKFFGGKSLLELVKTIDIYFH